MATLSPNILKIRKALVGTGAGTGKSKAGTRKVYSIQKHPKLYLATDGKGGGAWRIKYKPPGAKSQKWHTLSNDARNIDFDQVARKAGELLQNLSFHGVDPKAHRVTFILTFDVAFHQWLDAHAKVRKKSWEADEKIYHRHIKDRLGDDALANIDRVRVIEVLDAIAAKSTPIQANRCQAVISAVFSWALDEGKVKTHPALRIRRRGEERMREFVMTDEQLRDFWAKLDALLDKPATIIRLLLVTGCRLSEVAGAQRRELRFEKEREQWTIPSTRTKNSLTHIVPLTLTAVELWKGASDGDADNPYIFPAHRVTPQPFDGNHASRLCKEIFRDIGAPEMRLHDLRHQAATGMAQCGVPLEIRQLVMNQVTGRRQSIGSRYDQHDYSVEKRRALELWERRLLAIVAGRDIPKDRY